MFVALALVFLCSQCSTTRPSRVSGGPSSKRQIYRLTSQQVPPLGSVLATPSGMTLYKYALDSPGISRCTGTCATIWPPLRVNAGKRYGLARGISGVLSTILSNKGHVQLTYDGFPLYEFSGDPSPRRAYGNNLGGVWQAVVVSPPQSSTSSSSSQPGQATLVTGQPGVPSTRPVVTVTTTTSVAPQAPPVLTTSTLVPTTATSPVSVPIPQPTTPSPPPTVSSSTTSQVK